MWCGGQIPLGEAEMRTAVKGLRRSLEIQGGSVNDFDLAARLIGELKRPNLKLQFDVYHRQIIHGDVTRGLESLMPITGHIQISSAPSRHEPMSGELDDRRVFQLIEKLGYTGNIGCEYNPAAGTLAGLGWMKAFA